MRSLILAILNSQILLSYTSTLCVNIDFMLTLFRYIVQEGHKLNRLGSKLTNKPPLGSVSSVAWRAEGLQYKKNEVFLDVIEKINLFVRTFTIFYMYTTCCTR